MKIITTSRSVHRWLMLFIGVQMMIWSATGAYMVFFDIDYIHGDSLVQVPQIKINPEHLNYSTRDLYQRYPDAENLSVNMLINKEVYRFKSDGVKYLLDANSGALLSPLSEETAVNIAQYLYISDDEIERVSLIVDNPPFDVRSSALPAWRIDFDHFSQPSLYISARDGVLMGKRHDFWRLFDWMFRFHIMDYEGGEDIDNWLLFWVLLFALIASISGLVLIYYCVLKKDNLVSNLVSNDQPAGIKLAKGEQ